MCTIDMLLGRKRSTLIQKNGPKKEKAMIEKMWNNREFMT